MLPREHGACGQLFLPLLTALALGRPSAASLALIVGAAGIVAAHEPALVLLGRRGERARREQRRQAVRWLAPSAAAAMAGCAAAVALLDASSRVLLVPPAVLGAMAALNMLLGRERTSVGEILASTALASVSLPVAAASGASVAAAATCATTFAAAFAAATISVRAVIARGRGPSKMEQRAAIATDSGLMVAMVMLALGRVLLPAALWAAAPVCALALGLVAAAPPPRYLRRIGWTLVAATALAGGILILAIR